MKNTYDQIFHEYANRWHVTPQAVRIVFVLVDMNRHYVNASETLQSLGFTVKPRALRYFYKKIVLTDYYGTKKSLGAKNYRYLVLRKI